MTTTTTTSKKSTYQFQPVRASTPYLGGKQFEMQTMHHEQTGMAETSYDETPLLSQIIDPEEKQRNIDKTIDLIKSEFPKADFKKLPPIGYHKKGIQADIVTFGPRGGEEKILDKNGNLL